MAFRMDELEKKYNKYSLSSMEIPHSPMKQTDVTTPVVPVYTDAALSLNDIMGWILEDGTGLADFALISAGGSIDHAHTTRHSLLHFQSLFESLNPPEVAISPSVNTGECWPCQLLNDQECILTIKLAALILVRSVSIEHVSPVLRVSKVETYPKLFEVWTKEEENEDDESAFQWRGSFEYKREEKLIQTFPLSLPVPTQHVQLRIKSGASPLVCLYRVRVHGDLM